MIIVEGQQHPDIDPRVLLRSIVDALHVLSDKTLIWLKDEIDLIMFNRKLLEKDSDIYKEKYEITDLKETKEITKETKEITEEKK